VFSFADKREATQLLQQPSPCGFQGIVKFCHYATVRRGPGSAIYIDKQAEKN